MRKISILLFLVILALFTVFAVKAYGDQKIHLKTSYELYKLNFMTKDGRIIDYDKNNCTTSEGQSYMMLRSLVMKDKKTFDLVWQWTKNNLQREDDLFAWLWGKNKDGKYLILDNNSASDADIDIAFALLLAQQKWGDFQYFEGAKPIIDSIWNNETKQIGDYLVLMPGVKQTTEEKIEINPSYFSPYAFKFFQKYDEAHNWGLLVDSSYYYLEQATSKTTGLPVNWARIENGQIVLENSPKSDFSYDAVRVFARVYLDLINTGEPRALPILAKSKFFVDQWKNSKTFYVNYQENGQLRDKAKFVGSMSVLIPAIRICDKETANEMYESEVEPHFQDEKFWSGKTDYYGKNLSWFAYYVYSKNFFE